MCVCVNEYVVWVSGIQCSCEVLRLFSVMMKLGNATSDVLEHKRRASLKLYYC